MVHRLSRATAHLLDLERVDCGPATPDLEQAIAEETMKHMGGKVLSCEKSE